MYFSGIQINIPWEKATEKPEEGKSSKEAMGFDALKKDLEKYVQKIDQRTKTGFNASWVSESLKTYPSALNSITSSIDVAS